MVLSCSIIGYNSWIYISNNQLFYEYLFGAYGLKTYIWQQSLTATNWKTSILASPLAYYVFVLVAAIAGGLISYTILQTIGLLFASKRPAQRELARLGSSNNAILHALLTRLGLRILALVGWAIYTAFFFSTLVPFVLVLNQMGIGTIHAGQLSGWLECGGAILLLLLALHVQVIFIRLIFLRLRLFFAERAIEELEA